MKKLFAALFLALAVTAGSAQNTTVSMTAITDSDTTVWANATWQMNFVTSPSQPDSSKYTNNGSPVSPSVLTQNGSLNGSGTASITIYDNTVTFPLGSQWQLQLCPNATGMCLTYIFIASGTTLNISTAVNSRITAPRFQGIAGNRGYADIEVISPVAGATYYNTISASQRYYNGSAWASSGGASFPGCTAGSPNGISCPSAAVQAQTVSSCTGGFCFTITGVTPTVSINLPWTNGVLDITKDLHADFQINGATLNTNSASPNYNCSGVVIDPNNSCATPITNGQNYAFEYPTPASPSSLQAAYGNGFIALVRASGASNLTSTAVGDAPTLTAGTGSASGRTASAPSTVNTVSGAVSGNATGYSGNGVSWWTGLPVGISWFQFPAAGDFSAVRAYVGFCKGCSTSNLNADAADGGAGPVGPTSMAMINYSTVRGDSVWQCVTTADGTTYSVKAITSATPTTTGSYKTVAVNSSNVICTVGANSVTVTTNIPSAVANNPSWFDLSITQAASAVNNRIGGWYLYHQNTVIP